MNPLISEIFLEFDTGIPVYKQIFNQLSAVIASGRLTDGDKLPSIRELSSSLGINPNTVARAFLELEMKGYIEPQRGNGTFVSSRQNAEEPSPAEKKVLLERLFNKFIAEANCMGISRTDVIRYLKTK